MNLSILKTSIIACVLAIFVSNTFAQDFEGKIVFGIEYKKLPQEGMESMLPKESVTYVKNHLSRVETDAIMGMKTVIISNSKSNMATTLMDMLGQKYAIETNTKEEAEKNKTVDNAKVTITDETKMVAGYNCKKAIIETEEGKFIVWFTKDFKYSSDQAKQGALAKIDGTPLDFEMNQQGMVMRLYAKEITKGAVSDLKFEIPADYKKTTPEELKKAFGM